MTEGPCLSIFDASDRGGCCGRGPAPAIAPACPASSMPRRHIGGRSRSGAGRRSGSRESRDGRRPARRATGAAPPSPAPPNDSRRPSDLGVGSGRGSRSGGRCSCWPARRRPGRRGCGRRRTTCRCRPARARRHEGSACRWRPTRGGTDPRPARSRPGRGPSGRPPPRAAGRSRPGHPSGSRAAARASAIRDDLRSVAASSLIPPGVERTGTGCPGGGFAMGRRSSGLLRMRPSVRRARAAGKNHRRRFPRYSTQAYARLTLASSDRRAGGHRRGPEGDRRACRSTSSDVGHSRHRARSRCGRGLEDAKA